MEMEMEVGTLEDRVTALERGVTVQASTREAELERLLAAAEAELAGLKAGRKTQPAGVGLLAKDGGEAGVGLGALDAALVSLSLEQRIAVKAGLLRSGLIG
jgi:hypothetical protein